MRVKNADMAMVVGGGGPKGEGQQRDTLKKGPSN